MIPSIYNLSDFGVLWWKFNQFHMPFLKPKDQSVFHFASLFSVMKVGTSGQNYFNDMRAYIAHQSIEHYKCHSTKGRAAFYDQPFLKVFLKSNALFFGKNKYTNIRKCWAIFLYKTRIFSLKNVQKNIVLSKMAIQDVFNQS